MQEKLAGELLDASSNLVDVGEIERGIDALRVQVQGDVHEINIAGALAVAEQATLDALCAGHQGVYAKHLSGLQFGDGALMGRPEPKEDRDVAAKQDIGNRPDFAFCKDGRPGGKQPPAQVVAHRLNGWL